ncbi:MAG: alpha/beta hydrolase, partial [Actinomycetota bacterium]|nr:alpha/beta hydrolase [Actinomycetota bacterium]
STSSAAAGTAHPVAGRVMRAIVRIGRRVIIVLVGGVLALGVAAFVYNHNTSDTVPVPALDAHGHTVATGDLRTHYEQWGDHGSPIVLVHGFLESSATWTSVGPLLGKSHRVFALDVRGYGYTERKGPYTLESDTTQLASFLAAKHLDAAHGALPLLVGHSSGAAIVGNLARLHPAAAQRIVFLDGDGTPYGVGPDWVHSLIVNPFAMAAIRLGTRNSFAAAAIYRSNCGAGCPAFDEDVWLRPFRVPGAVDALVSILQRQVIGLTYAQEKQIQVPAAVIYGALDPQMSSADARETATRLHTTTIIAIPGAHHLVMLDSPIPLTKTLDTLAR